MLRYSRDPTNAPMGSAVVHRDKYIVRSSLLLRGKVCWMEDPRMVVRTSEYPNTNDPIVIPKLHKYIVEVFFNLGLPCTSSLASLPSSSGVFFSRTI